MASIVTPDSRAGDGRAWRIALFVAVSLGLHAGLYALLGTARFVAPAPPKSVDMEIVETRRPPPPKVEEKPPPPKPIERPRPVKVARQLPPPPKNAPPPPRNPTPPPPNQPPPPKAPPAPINIGLSLSSTTQAGGFSAPVGNTLYGKPADKAADPPASRPYAAPTKFVPSYQLTEPPQVEAEVKPRYPEEARKEGLEGRVQLKITIDASGAVTSAKLLQGAGHGFDESALEAIRKYRFKPASFNGEKVATEITYTVTFLLD